jgi:hypothetical protein
MPARERAQEVRRCIIGDVHGTLVAKWASQNLAAVIMLLWASPEPTTLEEKISVSTSKRSSARPPSSRQKDRHPNGARHGLRLRTLGPPRVLTPIGVAELHGERALARRPQGRLQPRSLRHILGVCEDGDQRWVRRRMSAAKGVQLEARRPLRQQ